MLLTPCVEDATLEEKLHRVKLLRGHTGLRKGKKALKDDKAMRRGQLLPHVLIFNLQFFSIS